MKKLILTLILLTGCTTMRSPDVSLVDLRFGEVTLMETSLVATVRFENENDQPLHVDGGVHKIYLNGIYVGKGMSDEKIDIPRLGSATQRITFHINNLMLLPKIQAILDSKEFRYEVNSRLYVTNSLGLPANIEVEREGTYEFLGERQGR